MIEGRKLLVERIAVMGLTPATGAADVSLRMERKWQRRFEQGGLPALATAARGPARPAAASIRRWSCRSSNCAARMPLRRITGLVRRSAATISRRVARPGLPGLKSLEPVLPTVRYGHATPGEMLHMDTKKRGRIVRPSHRVTGKLRVAGSKQLPLTAPKAAVDAE